MALADTKLARWALGFAEFVPLMAFAYAGRFGAEIAERFFWGAGSVLVIVPLLLLLGRRPNPLLVAANIWLCVEAFAFLVYIRPLADVLWALRETAFFVAIVAVGLVYLLVSERGLLTVDPRDPRQARLYSLALLALAMIAIGWSQNFRGDELVAAIIPGTVLFLAQMLLNARLRGRTESA